MILLGKVFFLGGGGLEAGVIGFGFGPCQLLRAIQRYKRQTVTVCVGNKRRG